MTTIALPQGRYIEGSLPLYADISLVTAERHAAAALLQEGDFTFAARSPTMPLTVDEFTRAALDYPIVFVGPARRAFAVTSLAADRNAFIDASGSYRPGTYIPAYLRRHPFALVRDPAGEQWVLGVDELSTRLAPLDEVGARALFDGTKPSDATREAVAFCEAFEAGIQRTERLVQLLDDLDLFESRQAHHRPRLSDGSEGEPVLLLDYVAVSRPQLEALDDAAFARLRVLDALPAIYAHLMSQSIWEKLAIAAARPDS